MGAPTFALLLLAVTPGIPAAAAAETVPPTAELQKAGVVTVTGEWSDPARGGRSIPWRAYLPAKSDNPVPVVIVSHGLGGSRDGMGYLGEALAKNGIATVHLQHLGSDTSVWKDKGAVRAGIDMKTAMSRENAEARVADVAYALDRLAKESTETGAAPFKGRLDLSAVGIAGHSFGALTTLQVAGMKTAGGATRDPRIKAALVLSPPQPLIATHAIFDGITIPTVIFTGTADTAIGTKEAKDRLKVFAGITRAPAWQVVFDGGDHMVYSGNEARRASAASAHYPAWRAVVTDMAVALFRSELFGDKTAATKLAKEAVTTRVGKLGTVSVKP